MNWQAKVYQSLQARLDKPLTDYRLTAVIDKTDLPMELYSLPDSFNYFSTGFTQEVASDCAELSVKVKAIPSFMVVMPKLTWCKPEVYRGYQALSLRGTAESNEVVQLYIHGGLLR